MSAQIITACALITGMVGASYALTKVAIWMWHTMRKVSRLADDLTGEPPRGLEPGRPGVLDRLAAIERHLERLDGFEARLARLDTFETRLAALEVALIPPASPEGTAA